MCSRQVRTLTSAAPSWSARIAFAFSVAAVQHDRGVMADPELAKREIDRPRRSAVPVDRVLQPVCVQVARPGDVPLGVFLWHPKVHVEEQELPVRWSRLRVLPVERLAEPFDMDEPVVLRQALDRSICDARPGQESAVENPNVED